MSRSLSPLRLLLALAVALLGLALLYLALSLTELGLSIAEHLEDAPAWTQWAYLSGVTAALLLLLWLAWSIMRPRIEPPVANEPDYAEPDTQNALLEQIEVQQQKGVDTSHAQAELTQLEQRQSSGEVHLALFGEINSGKSSLIQALLPDAEIKVSPLGGATRDLARYSWTTASGDRILLNDLPGLNEAALSEEDQAEQVRLIREEAIRAHLVLFLCEGDLTREQYQEVQQLRALHKPLIIVINKADRYSDIEQQQLRSRIAEHIEALPLGNSPKTQLDTLADTHIVLIQTGGQEEVILVDAQGEEKRVLRDRPQDIRELQIALQQQLDQHSTVLNQLRDSAIFRLAADKLEVQRQAQQLKRAEDAASQSTKQAVVAAMAAVAPGTDLLIQGYLGVRLVRKLCDIYEVPFKEIDAEKFIELAGKSLGRTQTLVLAVTGNALKAFPGIGTLTGGLLHAVAYGLVFDSLGRAAIRTLQTRGELRPLPAARYFEDDISENLESRAQRMAKLALEQLRREHRPGD